MTSTLTRRAQTAGAYLAAQYPSRIRPLAEPPRGSGLQPVMGRQGPPLVGYAPVVYDQLRWARQAFDELGPVHWNGMLGTRAVTVMGPEALEVVWANRDKAFSNELGFEYFIGPFFRRGLLLLDFDEHLHHRRIMQQAFTRPRLMEYLQMEQPGIDRDLGSWTPRERFPMYSSAKQMLLHLATEVFVGEEVGPETHRVELAFEDAVKGGQAYVRTSVPGGTWSRGLHGRRLLEEYFRSRIAAKRAGDGTDLFSVLCKAESDSGHRFTDEDIVNHMIFVLMAAHDTSTIALSMMTYLLGQNPAWQDRLRDEARALGKPAIEYADLDALPSLDLAFKESIRMFAPAGALPRETIKDTEILGRFVPAGTRLMLEPFVSMRLEKWWPDPDRFDPERFAEHRREDRVHRYAFSPFGGGAHKCIGLYFATMTVKAIMHQMLLKFEWSVAPDYHVPLAWGTGPIPSDGLPINLRRLGGGR